jgi:hypothetical protein
LAYSSVLQIKALRFSETSVNFYRTARLYIFQHHKKNLPVSLYICSFKNAGSNSDYMVPNEEMRVNNELYRHGRKIVSYLKTLSASRIHSIDDRMTNEYGVVGGMRVGKGNRSARGESVLVPLCSPQTPHCLTWYETRIAAVGTGRLTT